ncbi:hypothetical protein DFJ73DRAFT_792966, partial [Zopfochytrium polystomum]
KKENASFDLGNSDHPAGRVDQPRAHDLCGVLAPAALAAIRPARHAGHPWGGRVGARHPDVGRLTARQLAGGQGGAVPPAHRSGGGRAAGRRRAAGRLPRVGREPRAGAGGPPRAVLAPVGSCGDAVHYVYVYVSVFVAPTAAPAAATAAPLASARASAAVDGDPVDAAVVVADVAAVRQRGGHGAGRVQPAPRGGGPCVPRGGVARGGCAGAVRRAAARAAGRRVGSADVCGGQGGGERCGGGWEGRDGRGRVDAGFRADGAQRRRRRRRRREALNGEERVGLGGSVNGGEAWREEA